MRHATAGRLDDIEARLDEEAAERRRALARLRRLYAGTQDALAAEMLAAATAGDGATARRPCALASRQQRSLHQRARIPGMVTRPASAGR